MPSFALLKALNRMGPAQRQSRIRSDHLAVISSSTARFSSRPSREVVVIGQDTPGYQVAFRCVIEFRYIMYT